MIRKTSNKFIYPVKSRGKLFETILVWEGKESVTRSKEKCGECGHVRTVTYKNPKSPGEWVCQYCGGPQRRKYIATGHDHTDYSYAVCNCEGAAKHGKPYNELN
jgi:hypothetical protein